MHNSMLTIKLPRSPYNIYNIIIKDTNIIIKIITIIVSVQNAYDFPEAKREQRPSTLSSNNLLTMFMKNHMN